MLTKRLILKRPNVWSVFEKVSSILTNGQLQSLTLLEVNSERRYNDTTEHLHNIWAQLRGLTLQCSKMSEPFHQWISTWDPSRTLQHLILDISDVKSPLPLLHFHGHTFGCSSDLLPYIELMQMNCQRCEFTPPPPPPPPSTHLCSLSPKDLFTLSVNHMIQHCSMLL